MNPLTGVLGEAWRMYRAHAIHMLAIAFAFFIVTALLVGLLSLLGLVGVFLGWIVQLFSNFLLTATLIKAVQDVRDGRADLSFGETVSSAWPYILPVAAASILAGIAIAVGFVLIIVPGLILITIWAVIIPVIVLERPDAIASFGRSQQLVRGYGWQVFGTLVVLFIVEVIVTFVLGLIFGGLGSFGGHLLSTIITGTLIAPFIAITVTLIYYRLVAAQAGGPGAPYGAPGAPYGAPGDPYGGPPGNPPYGGPPGGDPYGRRPGDPYGRPPADPYGGQPGNQYGTPPGSPGDWFGGSSGR